MSTESRGRIPDDVLRVYTQALLDAGYSIFAATHFRRVYEINPRAVDTGDRFAIRAVHEGCIATARTLSEAVSIALAVVAMDRELQELIRGAEEIHNRRRATYKRVNDKGEN